LIRTHYVRQIDASIAGKEVVIAGWVHEVRNIGKIIFMLLRDRTGIIQVTAKKGAVDEQLLKSMDLPKESVVMVRGIVMQNSEARLGVEIKPIEVKNLNPLSGQIPFEVTGKVPADLDVRLDYRYIDLRRPETTAIFNVQSTIMRSFREILAEEGFVEIKTPSIVAAATEGGAELFPIEYFEKKAFLAQSPQLYKQLAVIGGLDKVSMIVPAFRAEKSNTLAHLSESTQMDIEMGFADYNDAIEMLKKVVVGIIGKVAERNKRDLEILGTKAETGDVKEVTYSQAVEKLNEHGAGLDFGSDISREHEQELQKIYGDLLIVKEYPTKLRAFYSMPNENDPELCHSYDFIYKGIEISSGAQRIHDPKMLTEAIISRGLEPKNFDFYINAFRKGAPPHAGWSIGLERFTMKITDRRNIRECSLFPRDRTRVEP